MLRNRTDSTKNHILKPYLEVLARCYSTGYFEELFPLLSDDIVFETMWVAKPRTGREVVEAYFLDKGVLFRQHDCCPKCEIVELVGSMSPDNNMRAIINGVYDPKGMIKLFYSDGKLCLHMTQKDNDSDVLVELTLDNQDKIARIDLNMPALYSFRPYTGDDPET